MLGFMNAVMFGADGKLVRKLNDVFTGTADSAITAHTPTYGSASWTDVYGYESGITGQIVIDASARCAIKRASGSDGISMRTARLASFITSTKWRCEVDVRTSQGGGGDAFTITLGNIAFRFAETVFQIKEGSTVLSTQTCAVQTTYTGCIFEANGKLIRAKVGTAFDVTATASAIPTVGHFSASLAVTGATAGNWIDNLTIYQVV